jgi:hypothetical protein
MIHGDDTGDMHRGVYCRYGLLRSFRLSSANSVVTLSMDAHVNFIISIACQRLFLIGQLKKQGLPKAARRNVFQALVVSRLTYALAAFAGFCLVGILRV